MKQRKAADKKDGKKGKASAKQGKRKAVKKDTGSSFLSWVLAVLAVLVCLWAYLRADAKKGVSHGENLVKQSKVGEPVPGTATEETEAVSNTIAATDGGEDEAKAAVTVARTGPIPAIPGLFTADELKLYDASDPDKPIYLAIVGEVFDVTRGSQHYGTDGGYPFFAGIDGSRAFVSGQFNETGLIPSLEGLPYSQYGDVQGWLEFYHTDYTFKGKLIGFYYDEEGKPTEGHASYLEGLKKKDDEAALKKAFDRKFPPCNSKWSQKSGGEVWCSNKSGGINRAWAGVPRLHVTGDKKKCVCVEWAKTPDMNPAEFEIYENCAPNSPRCKTPKKKEKKEIQ